MIVLAAIAFTVLGYGFAVAQAVITARCSRSAERRESARKAAALLLGKRNG